MTKASPTVMLDRILNSNTFANKEAMKGLLDFLYKSAVKGKALKEFDIAIDYFKRGDNFLPGDDTIVRVNIYKLRSLLEKYYENEGKKDEIVFEIPKGSYSLRIVSGKRYNLRKSKKASTGRILLLLLLISLLLNGFLLIKNRSNLFAQKNPVWNDYIKDGLPVYITLGNPFFFRVNDTTRENIIVRDITINSEDELSASELPLFPQKEAVISELDYPYFSTNNIMPLPDILGVFSKSGTEVRLQALSSLNSEEIKRNNEIFIANINSFGFVTRFLEQSSISLKNNPRQIIIKKDTGNVILSVPEYIQGYYTDYAFLVKLPGPENNYLSLMGDFHASGAKGLSNYITDENTLNELREKVKSEFGHFPHYFEMVVKVTSYNYVDFKTELIYFNPLQSEHK